MQSECVYLQPSTFKCLNQSLWNLVWTWAHLNGILHKSLTSVCVSACVSPLSLLGNCWVQRYCSKKYTRNNRRIVEYVVFCAVCVASKENRHLVLPRSSCLLDEFEISCIEVEKWQGHISQSNYLSFKDSMNVPRRRWCRIWIITVTSCCCNQNFKKRTYFHCLFLLTISAVHNSFNIEDVQNCYSASSVYNDLPWI
jgi:hypothetical protein